MARFLRHHPRVRELVERRLVPLFFVAKSVNALRDRLNDALKGRELPGVIYPNRIHSLFGDDDTQGVNEGTLETLERAAEAAWTNAAATAQKVDEAIEKFRAAVLQQAGSGAVTANTVSDAARAFGYPSAVAEYLSERTHLGIAAAATPKQALPASITRLGPDWSYQDKACEQCLAALARGRARKVGLILPTGAGKTRVALRIALWYLARHPSAFGPVIWVTHRRSLRRQALKELKKMLASGTTHLPPDAAALAKRIDFRMVGEMEEVLSYPDNPPLLLIVDEAHHVAARSYEAIVSGDTQVAGLFLTATPNRTDGLPIHIDEVAFTITYRELAERGVILLPQFRDFPVESFNWQENNVEDLADYVITHAADEYKKVLVLAPRLDRVEEFYEALLVRLAKENDHRLSPDDIGYVHSKGNSLDCETDDFLAAFESKPLGILVSAQMLLEGFDDPAIDTVVITYASESLIVLMQAAGRCVRYAPGKKAAYVVQATNERLAYHFDQRWLYQEISDFLHPMLVDVSYRTRDELVEAVTGILEEHNVHPAMQDRVLERVSQVGPGDLCRLLLTGLPYYGAKVAFGSEAAWGGLLETSENSDVFRSIFNQFCLDRAELSDPTNFLAEHATTHGIPRELREGSEWRGYMEMLTSMFRAAQEVNGGKPIFRDQDHRPYEPYRSTTWLKYVTFHYRPSVPARLEAFLQDCFNREAILAAYEVTPDRFAMLIKIPVPLDGHEAHLLDTAAAAWFCATLDRCRAVLRIEPPADRFATLEAERIRLSGSPLPLRVVARLEWFLPEEGFERLTLGLAASPEETSPAAADTVTADHDPEPDDD